MFKIIPREADAEAAAPLQADAADRLRDSRRLFAAAAVLAVLAVLAVPADLPLAVWLKTHDLPGDLRRLVHLSEAFAFGGTVALIVLAAALLDRRGWRVVPRLAIGTAGAGIVAESAKLVVARLRPMAANLEGSAVETFVAWWPAWQRQALGQPYGYKLQSFPSGHAATAAGLAIALSALYPRGRWLFFTLAVLAAVQRVEGDAHFLSDVLAGGAIACLVAAVCALPGPLRWLAVIETGRAAD